jgi:hypothetical protein
VQRYRLQINTLTVDRRSVKEKSRTTEIFSQRTVSPRAAAILSEARATSTETRNRVEAQDASVIEIPISCVQRRESFGPRIVTPSPDRVGRGRREITDQRSARPGTFQAAARRSHRSRPRLFHFHLLIAPVQLGTIAFHAGSGIDRKR